MCINRQRVFQALPEPVIEEPPQKMAKEIKKPQELPDVEYRSSTLFPKTIITLKTVKRLWS